MSGDQHNEFVFVFKLWAKNDIWSFILRFHSSIPLNMKENKEKKSEDRRNQAMLALIMLEECISSLGFCISLPSIIIASHKS